MTKRVLWSGEPIPPERWGKDHLSTLLYVESCVVDGVGMLDERHLRTGSRTSDYPTRLCDGMLIEGHDDHDCLSDLGFAGMLEFSGTKYSLTDSGWALAARVRKHLGMRPSGRRTYDGFQL